LLGAKRNAVLELWEVQRYGSDSYGDADYVSIYGMRPADWHSKGVRLLGRTAVECTRDKLGDTIGREVAEIAASRPPTARALIIDLFAGSGNTLHWLLRHLPDMRGVGFESDVEVFRLTRQNIAALALPIDILNTDYLTGLDGVSVSPDELLITFIAPPWGDALDKTSGLDLRRTTPPITEVVDFLLHKYSENRLLCAIQAYEIVLPASMAELKARFDWATLRINELNIPGHNHGILLGTKGWVPSATVAEKDPVKVDIFNINNTDKRLD
jgi:16S rRNA G966 N2-methylase RsmD